MNVRFEAVATLQRGVLASPERLDEANQRAALRALLEVSRGCEQERDAPLCLDEELALRGVHGNSADARAAALGERVVWNGKAVKKAGRA